jgi:hypothetical protein
MTVTKRPTVQKKNCSISIFLGVVSRQDPPKAKGDGGSVAQKRRAAPLPDTVRARKNSSTPVASDTTAEKGAVDKNKSTTIEGGGHGTLTGHVRTGMGHRS